MNLSSILSFCKEHKYAILYGFLGLIAALLMLIIGFFKTLLIYAMLSIGVLLGYSIDKVGAKSTWSLVKRIFTDIKNKF